MITEEKAREIFLKTRDSDSFNKHPIEELRECDRYIREYALTQFNRHLNNIGTTSAMRNFIYTMVRCHYGSVEVDELLVSLSCYPTWMQHGCMSGTRTPPHEY